MRGISSHIPVNISYSLYRSKPKKTSKKSESSTHKSSIETKNQTDEIVIEDTDSSSSEWRPKERDQHETPTPSEWAIQTAHTIDLITGNLPKTAFFKTRAIIPSYKTITIPEALLYCLIINGESCKKGTLKGIVKHFRYPNIECDIAFASPNSSERKWRLLYNPYTLSHKLIEKNSTIGHFRTSIRSKKVEEIEGYLYKKELVIDPKWHPKKKNKLTYQIFKYNEHSLELFYLKNETYGFWKKKKTAIKTKTIKKKSGIHVVKTLNVLDHSIQTELMYHPKILVPLGLTIQL